MLENWLRHVGDSAAAILDYVEGHWYGGGAGSSITLYPSIPESNPFARGYARASTKPSFAKGLDRFPEIPAWTQQRAA